jgi:hypothetical protein
MTPEMFLQGLTQDERDRLLHQLLTMPHQYGGTHDTSRNRQKTTMETDIINLQHGIMMSLREQEQRSRWSGNTEDESMELGRRASESEYNEYCRRRRQDEENDARLLAIAKSKSLRGASFDQEDLERARAESLYSPSHEQVQAELIDSVKRVSLDKAYGMTREEQLIDDVKRASYMTLSDDEVLIEEARAASLSGTMSMAAENLVHTGPHQVGTGRQQLWQEPTERMEPLVPVAAARQLSISHHSASIASSLSFPPMPILAEQTSTSSTISDRKPPAKDHP